MTQTLTYDTRGDGPRPVLLLHGFLGSGRNLSSFARKLVESAPELRCVLADLTGHGASPALPPRPTLTDVARDVLALVARLGAPGPVDVIGHSFGGRAALEARRLEPKALARIVLLDIAPGPVPTGAGSLDRVLSLVLGAPDRTPDRESMRRHFLERGLSAPLTEWLILNLTGLPEGSVGWRIDRAALAALDAASRPIDLWSAIDAQTLCVRGGRSDFVTKADAERMRSLGCTVSTIAEAGHFVHVDALGELVEIVGTWLRAPKESAT